MSLGDVVMPVLRRNSNGPAVSDLQARLIKALGSDWSTLLSDGDGFFGARTDAAVRKYQSTNGLAVDGIVGAATWSKLIGLSLTPPRPLPAVDAVGAIVPTEVMKTSNLTTYLLIGAAGVLIVLGLVLRPKRVAVAGYSHKRRRR